MNNAKKSTSVTLEKPTDLLNIPEQRHETASVSFQHTYAVLALLFIVILVIYFNIFSYDFIEIDDGGQVTDNPYVKSLNLSSIVTLFSTSVVSMYQPLTSIANGILVAVFGLDATPIRVLSVILHTINAFLFYTIANTLLGHRGKALTIALLMATHPLMVETVTWVSAISTLWFTLFFLLSLKFYLNYLKLNSQTDFLKSVVCFIIGALYKVQIIPLVGVLFLCDALFHLQHNRPLTTRTLVINKIPFIISAIVFLMIALLFRGDISGFPGYGYSPHLLIPSQFTWYAVKLLIPYNLGIQYDWPEEALNGFTLFSYAFTLMILLLLYKLRKNTLFLFGILFFAGNILLHTTPFTQFLGPYADRYAYLSTFGLLIALFSLIPMQYMRRLYAIFGLLVMGCGTLAYQQVSIWENTLSVWSHNISHQSATFSYGMRGALYYQQGNPEKAKSDFQTVADNPDTRLDPAKYAYLYTQLAILITDEDPEKAYHYFKKVLDFKMSPTAILNVAQMAIKTKKYQESEAYYQQVINNTPPQSNPHVLALQGLLNLLYATNRNAEMLPTLSKLINIKPHDITNRKKRALIHYQLGNKAAALTDLNKAIELTQNAGLPINDPMLMQLQINIQSMTPLIE